MRIFGGALAGYGAAAQDQFFWRDRAEHSGLTWRVSAIPKIGPAAAAAGQIRDVIMSGAVTAGDELPSGRELVLQLGTNRTTAREVLTHLDLLGLIDRQGRRCVCSIAGLTGRSS